ncbi:MAG: ParB/RepB/Spo0J family partition protein [Phenylobacterium sp.]|uniref:ParB/RepB/Spo0J family partition protein n=1 Tax=Phenylobacterium sp. TaxID=1871053 RepID=UPI00391BECAE
MAENRRGLGRGLSALLGDVAETEAAAAPAEGRTREARGVQEIPIDLIHRNPDQPRRTFGDVELIELTESIREKGVLQPILLRPSPKTDGEYEVVAGERRWRAAQMAGLNAMPAVVRELDDLQVLEIAIVENVQRADLNPIEEGLGFKALMDRFGRTQEAIAQAVGKSRSHIANTLRLLQLPVEVQDHVMHGRLSAGHARAIATAENAAALADRIVEQGLSVREAEALARKGAEKSKASGPRKSSGSGKTTDTMALENDLSEVLGLDVSISDRGGAGELTISYTTLEQLDDLCRRLTRAG